MGMANIGCTLGQYWGGALFRMQRRAQLSRELRCVLPHFHTYSSELDPITMAMCDATVVDPLTSLSIASPTPGSISSVAAAHTLPALAAGSPTLCNHVHYVCSRPSLPLTLPHCP